MSTNMKHRGRGMRVLIAATVVGIAGFGASAAQVEPTVTCNPNDADIEPIPFAYGTHTSGCAIDESVDTDRFTFEGAADDRVRFHLDAISGNLDPRMEIRDPVGAVIADEMCANGCTLVIDEVLPTTGTYQITVSDWGLDEGGSYMLQIERVPTTANVPVLKFSASQQDAISQSTDIDFFRFEGVAGSIVRLTLDAISGNLDPRVEVFDECGAMLCNEMCANGCSIDKELTLKWSGTYWVAISDWGLDEGGDYLIALSCNFGPCACLQNDLSDDGSVGFADLVLLLGLWGDCKAPLGCATDLNGDGSTGFTDLTILLGGWGDCVTEPVCSSP